MQKTVLFLGASHIQIPPIRYAKARGYAVITCDNIPSNPGHLLADESFCISATDMDSVYQLSKERKIDGIVAYASDPCAPTAAYVGNKLGLQSNPYEAVRTLCNKAQYRAFLRQNGFNTPQFIEARDLGSAISGLGQLRFPLFVKPNDASGSKGVSQISAITDLPNAFNYALEFSRCGSVIIEEMVQPEKYQIAGDAFIVGGKVVFHCLANEHFNLKCNPNVPIGESFPSTLSPAQEDAVIEEINRLISVLPLEVGAINIDAMIDKNGQIFLMEIGPRNGGNLIPEVIGLCTGVDLIAYTVEASLGDECNKLKQIRPNGYYSSFIIHSSFGGVYQGLHIDRWLSEKIVSKTLFTTPGEKIYPFNGSQYGLGNMILRFESEAEMLQVMDTIPELVYPLLGEDP